jgi:hypothetical protein
MDNRADITTIGDKVKMQREVLDDGDQCPEEECDRLMSDRGEDIKARLQLASSSNTNVKEDADAYDIDLWEPKPPKVLMNNSDAVPLELRAQVQQYATTE